MSLINHAAMNLIHFLSATVRTDARVAGGYGEAKPKAAAIAATISRGRSS